MIKINNFQLEFKMRNYAYEDTVPKKITRTPSTKQEINNTPLRARDAPYNKENNLAFQNKNAKPDPNYSIKDDLSTNDILLMQAENPNNSFRQTQRKKNNVNRGCVNHADIESEFRIMIDNEILSYCNKCAAHLASNGFQVERISALNKSPNRMRQQQGNLNQRSPQNRRKMELTAFIQSLKILQEQYGEKAELYERVNQSYQIEKETIGNFYASMTEYIDYLRDEHLKFIEEESIRNLHIGDVESGEVQETLAEIEGMKDDIETNLEKIIEDVDDTSYTECMSYYTKKYALHDHRLQQLAQQIKPANCTSAHYVEDKLHQFKEMIDELTGIRSSKMESSLDH